jgi:hypothetical protein
VYLGRVIAYINEVIKIVGKNIWSFLNSLGGAKLIFTLYLFCVFGFVGILPDLDHTAHYLATGEAVSPTTFGGRDFHIPIFVAAWVVFLGTIAHVGRLYVLVLEMEERRKERTMPPPI